MLVANLTHFPFATLITSRRPPQVEMTIVVRGRFDAIAGGVARIREGMPAAPFDPMAQGVLSGDTFAENDDAAEGAVLHPSDLAPYKLNAEVLVTGSCHVPGHALVTECTAAVKVGQWSKGLKVVGRRTSSSKPIPFSSMPLDWTHAYGGPGDPDNPVGKGRVGSELPNLLPVGSGAGTQRVVNLGAVSPRWPLRAAKLGKNYGPVWQKTRAPWPSDDFDWTHYHSALPDQQLTGYLRGDELVTLTNLHPEHGQVETQLPGVRVRAFVRRATREIVEVPMSIDTLVVRSDEGAIDLAWRGLCAVAEDDLADIVSLLLVREEAGAPLTHVQCKALLEKHEADPTGAIAATPPDLVARRDEAMAMLADSKAAKEDLRTGRKTPEEALPDIFVAALPPGDPRAVEVRAATQRAIADLNANKKPGEDPLKQLVEKMPAPRGASPPPFRIPEVGAPPRLPPQRDLAKSIDLATEEARKARKELECDPKGEAQAKADELIGKLEELRKNPRFELVFKPRVEPGPGKDLSDQDLEGEDLRGADLRGANLEGSVLTRADLRGANLAGARLSHAVLFQARLDDADLSSTTLTLTNFTEAQGERLRLRGATVDRTFFDRAVLPGLDATGLNGKNVLFIESKIERAKLDEARLEGAFFDRASLAGTSFKRALLVRCLLVDCNLRTTVFEGAGIGGTSFMRSDASGAIFDRCSGANAVFLEATLDDASFQLARLASIFASGISAKRASFYGADLRGGRFVRAGLERASFERANLKDADLRKVLASSTSFRGASLFAANLLGASGRDADFSGANLKRAQIDM